MVGKQIIQLESDQKAWVRPPPMGVSELQISAVKDVQQHQPLGEFRVKHCDMVPSAFQNGYNCKDR